MASAVVNGVLAATKLITNAWLARSAIPENTVPAQVGSHTRSRKVNPIQAEKAVLMARARIELATPRFSVVCSTN